jgi:hypothetical protein
MMLAASEEEDEDQAQMEPAPTASRSNHGEASVPGAHNEAPHSRISRECGAFSRSGGPPQRQLPVVRDVMDTTTNTRLPHWRAQPAQVLR